MATKMELVLSPGNLGGDATDGPFRNEDVREWSRVDRITGMLERARVETGRWRANTGDAAQSYGKMVDSRERNSADGSLVQKARRQVEIFQSQGAGGRSFQVVRASQWSSSRATDCQLDDVPAGKMSQQQSSQYLNGGMSSGPWRASLAEQASDLEQLSCLCRQLHDEALSQSRFWPLDAPLSASLLESPEAPSLAERRSNSSEDLTSLPAADSLDEGFARDCRARRSLQLEPEVRPVAERARRFEEAAARPPEGPKPAPRSFLAKKPFGSIADNDFVKNDPNHPSKLGQQLAKVSIVKDVAVGAVPSVGQPVQPSPLPRRNRTVVVLGADTEDEAARRVNVTAIKVEKEPASEYASLADATSVPIKEDTTATPSNGLKPVKRVEFCKTEIHFAPDSGKVNIVETDGKPPPTNKFRRRRRNSLNNSTGGAAQQRNSLPLVHFGDTSYEKFIFGGQGRSQDGPALTSEPTAVEPSGAYSEPESRAGWNAPEKLREEVVLPVTSEPRNDAVVERTADHRQKGGHTTTVNFLSSENGPLPKLEEGAVAGMRLQIGDVSGAGSAEADLQSAVSRTTKITLRLQGAIGQRCPLRLSPFANLKSVRLVMSIGREKLDRLLLSTLCRDEPPGRAWSLSLDSQPAAPHAQDPSTPSEEKPSSPLFLPGASSHIAPKEIVPLERLQPTSAQVVSKDSENNQVLLKIVTTHKPTLARVESVQLARPRPDVAAQSSEQQQQQQRVSPEPAVGEAIEAKEHCDKAALEAEQPTYENVFEAVAGDGLPVYENCRAQLIVAPENKTAPASVEDEPPKRPRRQWKKTPRELAELVDAGFARSKPGRPGSPVPSGTRRERSSSRPREQHAETKRRPGSRSSGSRDGSVKKGRETRTSREEAAKAALARRKHGSRSETLERKAPTNRPLEKNGSTRSKKAPVEVVYQTAVYNIKNEKLSKPTKVKEVKGPRLINELICGSKTKRPTDKKAVKTTHVLQNTSKRKENPAAMKS